MKRVIPLALLLLTASPGVKGEGFVLPLPLNENTIETISTFRAEGNRENIYSFSFYSASKRSDNKFVVIWGFDIRARSNLENYTEIFKNLENDYKTAIDSYDSLKADTASFIRDVNNLEARINDPSFSEKANDIKDFVANWNNQLPLDIDYSFEKNDIEQCAKFVNTAKDINKAYDSFKELTEFITETKNSTSNDETKNLAYIADASRQNLDDIWGRMSNSTNRLYNVVIDKNLESPYANTDFNVFFRIVFPFYGRWLMGQKGI